MIALVLTLALAAASSAPPPQANTHHDIVGFPDGGSQILDRLSATPSMRLEDLDGARQDAGAPKVTLAAAGDVTLGYHFEEYFDLRLDGGSWMDGGAEPAASAEQLLAYPFAKVEPVLAKADVAVVNLECPFTSRGEKIEKNFNFRASPELAKALPPSGVDVVSLANNHMMDYGPDGVADTLAALDGQHIAHFGAGMNLAEARKPAIVERHGEKVAFLGYLYIGNPPIEPLVVWAQKDKPGVAGAGGDLDALLAMLRADIRKARKQADVVIVFFHFGKEAHHEIQPYQATLAHAAVDDGANLVLGSHPHVLQGAERYKGVPIVYSLGNFVFGGNANPRNKESAIFEATLSGKKVARTDFVPVQITRVPDAPFQPFLLDGADRARVRSHLADYSKTFPLPLIRNDPALRIQVDFAVNNSYLDARRRAAIGVREMKILVTVKRVEDPESKIKVKPDGSGIVTEGVNYKMNPFDEIAVEEALRLQTAHKGEVVVISMGKQDVQTEIRQALAMGADRGIWVNQDGPLDPDGAARLLQKIAEKEKPDLVILGKQAIDDDQNQTGQLLAERLGWGQATFASKEESLESDAEKNKQPGLKVTGAAVQVVREVDGGLETLEVSLPAVVTTDLRLNKPRYATLPGIMKAKKKPLEELTAAGLGVDVTPKVAVQKLSPPPARQAGIKVADVAALYDKLHNEAKAL